MPVLFAWFFGAGGVALARGGAGDRQAEWSPARLTRLLAALACLFVAVTPALVAVSQQRLNRSVNAFKRGDCATTIDSALGSLDVMAARAEPYELLGYCDARAGQDGLAVRAMEGARERDPGNWEYAYGLAVTQALEGRDPRAAAELARRLNPKEPLAIRLERGLRSDSPARRRQVAARADIPFQ
jgi:Flp pilus assembly protein TadD